MNVEAAIARNDLDCYRGQVRAKASHQVQLLKDALDALETGHQHVTLERVRRALKTAEQLTE